MKGIFQRFAVKSLAANRTRTLVTIIGITLSMALLTAVIEGAYSGWVYMRDIIVEENGSWEGAFLNQTEEQREIILEEDEIKEAASLRQIGWAQTASTNTYKPYLLIQAYEEGFVGLAGVNVLEGRLPENINVQGVYIYGEFCPAHGKHNDGLYNVLSNETFTILAI